MKGSGNKAGNAEPRLGPEKKHAELGLGAPGKAFWMREYWDRYIRDEKYYDAVADYIHNNPVKAGLCKIAAEWRWSSAGEISSG